MTNLKNLRPQLLTFIFIWCLIELMKHILNKQAIGTNASFSSDRPNGKMGSIQTLTSFADPLSMQQRATFTSSIIEYPNSYSIMERGQRGNGNSL